MVYLISAYIGLALGSFANVCILRLPDDKSIWWPRSRCPHCGRALKIWHNIPLASFLLLNGRCAFCHAPISWQYPIVEAALGALFIFHAYYFRSSLAAMVVSDLLIFFLLTLSIIDFRHRIIPDELSLALALLGLAIAWVNPFLTGKGVFNLVESGGSALAGGLLMWAMAWLGERVFRKEALGGGDIKLVAATAAVLGWRGILGPLLIGSLIGGVFAITLLLLKKKRLGETLPFGPFLSLGAYLVCLFPGLLKTLLNPEIKFLNFP